MDYIVIGTDLVLLMGVGYLVWCGLAALRNYPAANRLWQALGTTDQQLLQTGLILVLVLPFLKLSGFGENYLALFLAELAPVAAAGFLLAGLLACGRSWSEADMAGR